MAVLRRRRGWHKVFAAGSDQRDQCETAANRLALEVEKLLVDRFRFIESDLLDKYAEIGVVSVEG
jgi:hypothetical protein